MILTQATDAQLAAAVEENLFALLRANTRLPGSEIQEGETLSRHCTPLHGAMFRSAWRTRLEPDAVDSAIDRTIDWFKARESAYFAWWIGATTQPADLGARLEARGFELDYIADGMAADLHALNEAIPAPDGFSIVPAIDTKTMDDWRDVLCATYDMPLSAGQVWIDATVGLGITAAPWMLYTGYLNDQPVATSMVFNAAGVAGLYMIAALPEVRRKGIGAAVTLKPLLDARDQGYHYAVLFASELGVPLYQRLGFRDMGVDIGRYWWENPE